MLREARAELRTQGLPAIDHRVLAELAGYVCVFKHRSFNEDQTPDESSRYVTVVNVRAPIPTETDVAAPTPNEAWQTFLTMIWSPDFLDKQCREVLIGAMMTDKTELGRQIQADLMDLDSPTMAEINEGISPDPMTCVQEGKPFTYGMVADIALMTNKALLRAVRACGFFQEAREKLEQLLEEAQTNAPEFVGDRLPSVFDQPAEETETSAETPPDSA